MGLVAVCLLHADLDAAHERAVARRLRQQGLDVCCSHEVSPEFACALAEADRVLGVLDDNGLARGRNGLEVYVMAEIPANVILAAEFAQRFDGFSIGSNDHPARPRSRP